MKKNNRKFKISTNLLLAFMMLMTALLPYSTSVYNVFASEPGKSVELNETNFPDEKFRNYIQTKFDTNSDNILDTNEINEIGFINVDQKGITSLKGIEHFPNLYSIHADVNRIKELDISNNKKLQALYVNNNELETVKFYDEPNETLRYVDIFANHITHVDLKNLKGMQFLHIDDNRLTELDLSHNPLTDGHGFVAQNNFIEKITLPNNNREYDFKEYLATQLFRKEQSLGHKIVWYTDEAKTQELDPNKTPRITLTGQTLYAKYVPITYTIKYGSAEGTGTMDDQTITYGEKTKLSANKFQRPDYIFAGWKDHNNKIYKDEQEVLNLATKDGTVLNFYATWSEKGFIGEPYKVILHQNDSQTQIDAKFGTPVTLNKVTDSKEGYTFKGWSTTKNGRIAYQDGETFTINSPSQINNSSILNLYGVWEKNTYDVTFHNGNETQVVKVNYGETVKLPTNPTKTGYKFNNWQTKDGQILTDNQKITSNLDVFANFTPIQYFVTFNGNGADNADAMNNSKLTVAYDQETSLPKNLYTKQYNTFAGWSLEANGEVMYKDLATISNLTTEDNKTINLYAKWVKEKVQVTFVNDGKTEVKELEAGSTIALPTLSKTGYIFEGWYVQGTNTKWTAENLVKENMILEAKYRPIQYTIHFDKNGNDVTGEMNDLPMVYDTEKALPKNTLQKPNHQFVGWSLTKNGDVSYHDQANLLNLTTKDNDTITLYATWSQNVINVTIHDGVNNTYTIPVNQGSTLPSSVTIDRPGYTFGGWYTTEDFKEGSLWKQETPIQEAITLYAKWNLNTYQISFEEVQKDPIQVTANDKVTLEDPIKEGYDFLYWLDQDGNKYFNEIANITKNITLKPIWKQVIDSNFIVDHNDEKEFLYGMSQTEKNRLNSVFETTFNTISTLKENNSTLIEKIEKYKKENKPINGAIEFTPLTEKELNNQEKQLIKDKLSQLSFKENRDYTIAQYYDIKAIVRSNSTVLGNLNQLAESIELSFAIPTQLQKEGRMFYVIRVHNGNVEILDLVDDTNSILKVLTDRFSTYAIAYSDKKQEVTPPTTPDSNIIPGGPSNNQQGTTPSSPNTGYNESISLFVTMASLSIGFMLILVYRKRKENK